MSLIDVFETHGVEYRLVGSHHHVTQNWCGVDCPQCSPNSQSFRLGFHLTSGRAACWSCGKINPVQALADICGIPKSEAYKVIKSFSFLDSDSLPQSHHTGTYRPPRGVGPFSSKHKSYLRSRGFEPDSIQKLWNVQGIGLHPRLAWRLFLPISDQLGKDVSWTTRAIAENAARRYISASSDEEAHPHKQLLYGASMARHAAICVEGPIDAWSFGVGGVATFGLSLTQSQIHLMGQFVRRVVCFDSTPDGQRKARQVCQQLSILPGETLNIELESGKDANSADPREVAEIRSTYLESC